jgi:hypothetical protein
VGLPASNNPNRRLITRSRPKPDAYVDWAVAQCHVLEKRIVDWIESSPYVAHTDKDAQTGEETWKVDETEPIPRLINAEAGAIINIIRSSLDLLANALAERNGHFGTKDVYFPVSRSSNDFVRPKGSAYKK